MRTRRRTNIRRKVSRRKNRRPRLGINHLPMISTTPALIHRFRFEASSALVSTAVLYEDLAYLIQIAATTTTTYALFETVRIVKIEMWGPPSSSLAPVTVSCEFEGNSSIDTSRKVFSDTSLGSTEVAHVSARPDTNSTAGMWQSPSGSTAFYLNGPTNCIVDVTIETKIINNLNGDEAPGALTVVGATVGQVYYGRLDGPTTGLLIPVAVKYL
jgi:hypothetical protein